MTTAATLLTAVAALLFAVSCCAYKLRSTKAAVRLLIAGWCVCAALLALHAIVAQAPPFGNMRHVLCFFPLAIIPAWIALVRRQKLPMDAQVAAVACLALIGALCMPLQTGWRQAPALQSAWFVPHVASYVVAYGLLALSASCALMAVGEGKERQLLAADSAARLAFPFLTLGLCSGALWADAAWGRYWAWDIKETWSLITWVLYLIYFHSSSRFPAARRSLLLLAFGAALITFIVVNLLPGTVSSLHSYARGA